MSFEEAYLRYPFSGLVWLGIVVATSVRGWLDRRQAARAETRPYESEITPATNTQAA